MTLPQVFLLGFVQLRAQLWGVAFEVEDRLTDRNVHVRSVLASAKAEVVAFNVLNEVFVRFRLLESRVGPESYGALRVEDGWLRSSVDDARAEILVLNLTHWLVSYVLPAICIHTIWSDIESSSQSRVSEFKVAALRLQRAALFAKLVIGFGEILVSQSSLRLWYSGMIAKSEMSPLCLKSVSLSFLCWGEKSHQGQATISSHLNISHL